MGNKANLDRGGQQIADRYRLDQVIGAGGMGVVYRGVHLWTGRDLAVKLLEKDASETAGRRFLREARTAAAVRHPNLVEVIDVGVEDDGAMYLVLELLEGESFSQHLKRKGPMAPADALDVIVPILDALHALHRAEVVHRDIKPGNIYLSLDGTARVIPKLLDLGISKKMSTKEALTETGAVLGTPHYMSPEMAMGDLEVGVPADIWAMGVVLYEALAGERPFRADSVPGLLHKIATTRPVSLAVKRPDLPEGLVRVIDGAMAYEPEDRPKSAADLADALVGAALDAGLVLSCRMPSGPRISLAPLVPSLPPESKGLVPADAAQSKRAESNPQISISTRAEAPRRSLRGTLAIAALVVLAGVGGGVLFSLTSSSSGSDEPVRAGQPPRPDAPAADPGAEARAGSALALQAGGGLELVPDDAPAEEAIPDAGPTRASAEPTPRAVRRPRPARPRPPRPNDGPRAPIERGANDAPILGQ